MESSYAKNNGSEWNILDQMTEGKQLSFYKVCDVCENFLEVLLERKKNPTQVSAQPALLYQLIVNFCYKLISMGHSSKNEFRKEYLVILYLKKTCFVVFFFHQQNE